MDIDRQLRIAHFTNTYHPVISGVVRSVSSFRRALSKLGQIVFVFAQRSDDYEDVEPFIFRYPTLPISLPGDYPATLPFSPIFNATLPVLKPHIIHSHHPILLGQMAAHKAAELGIPLVYTYHTQYREYSHYAGIDSPLIKKTIDTWVAKYMRQCDHIIVPSATVRNQVERDYTPGKPISVLPTGLDLTTFNQIDRDEFRHRMGWNGHRIIVSVGRLAKEKNWELLLQAIGLVMADIPHIRLVIIGGGDEQERLEQVARRLGIRRRVQFTGQLPLDEVPSYLAGADLFCFASVTETQGLVTMEALAAGLPVVAVNGPGTRDVVGPELQKMLTPNDSTALAATLRRVLGNDELRDRLCSIANEQASHFDIEKQAACLIDIYRQTIATSAAGLRQGSSS